MRAVWGTGDFELFRLIMGQLTETIHGVGETALLDASNLHKAFAPKDEIEALLAGQMAATHHQAMDFLARTARSQTLEGTRVNGELANKLMRTFTAQLEALNRHRGKGQQRVTVEHVTVNSGGQAIVGAIEAPKWPPGGGDGN